jgi:hypothetical protein
LLNPELNHESNLAIIPADDNERGKDPEWTSQECRSDYRALWLDGSTRVSYFEVPGLGHVHPGASWFERGLTALDQSTPLTPPIISPTRDANPLPGQLAQAQRILATGQFYLEVKPPPIGKTRQYLEQVRNEYPTMPVRYRVGSVRMKDKSRCLRQPDRPSGIVLSRGVG